MHRGFGIFRPTTWASLTKYAIVFVVAMNLARLETLNGMAALIALAALALVILLTWIGILPIGGDKPEWRRLIRRHGPALTKRYRQLVRVNAYGAEEFDKWYDELARFREAVKLDLDESTILSFDIYATRLVKAWAARPSEAAVPEAMEEITPEDYEHLCADLLRKAGWDAEVTGQSGDQGVDVLARHGDIAVALQCKLYFGNPVGNKAVQEAHAAAGYSDADYAVVVSNRDFTNAAEQLARKLGVLLLHHSELPDLAAMLEPQRA
jgi:restriction system protein